MTPATHRDPEGWATSGDDEAGRCRQAGTRRSASRESPPPSTGPAAGSAWSGRGRPATPHRQCGTGRYGDAGVARTAPASSRAGPRWVGLRRGADQGVATGGQGRVEGGRGVRVQLRPVFLLLAAVAVRVHGVDGAGPGARVEAAEPRAAGRAAGHVAVDAEREVVIEG